MYAPTTLRCFGVTPRELLQALLAGLPTDAHVTLQSGGLYVEHPSLTIRMHVEELVALPSGLVVASVWSEALDVLGVRFPPSWTVVWTHDREKGRLVRITRGEEIVLDAWQDDAGSYALDVRGAAIFRGDDSSGESFWDLLGIELATQRASLGAAGIALDGLWPDENPPREQEDVPF